MSPFFLILIATIAQKIREKGYYYLKGKVQSRDGRLQMVLMEAEEATNQRFWIQLFDHQEDRAVLDILKAYPGPYPVVIRYEEEKKDHSIKRSFRPEKREVRK